jgi:hypothetical protein
MSKEAEIEPAGAPPPVVLLQMMTGYWVSQAIYVAAKLGIADLLTSGPKTCDELAEATDCHPQSLHRVLRALSSTGIFTETTSASFALTPMAEFLRSDHPGSMRALACMYAEEQYRAWGDLLHSVKTGQRAFDNMFGADYFAYLASHPESEQVFNRAMTGWTNQLVAGAVDAYDFSGFKTVVDVGGGHGTLLAAVLQRHPGTQGILFDQTQVVEAASDALQAAGVADRCTLVGGDFFSEVPSGGDAYVLSQILHDWDDERCIEILQQCRRAIQDDGRLLVVEMVLPEGQEPFFGKWLDLHMLVLLGARERTAAEYNALFHAAGFGLTTVVAMPAGPSVVEAAPA